MPLFDAIVEGLAKLMGLEPERAPARARLDARASVSERADAADESEDGPELRGDVSGARASDAPDEGSEAPEQADTSAGEGSEGPSPHADVERPALEPGVSAQIERLLDAAMRALPKIVAVAAVDVERGVLLALRSEGAQLPVEVRACLADATRGLLDAPYFAAAERELGRSSSDDADTPALTQQAIMLSTSFIHLFVRLAAYPSLVLVVVCRADTNLGLTLTRLRRMSAEAR